jgi:hypothetical protein
VKADFDKLLEEWEKLEAARSRVIIKLASLDKRVETLKKA